MDSRNSRKTSHQTTRQIATEISPAIEEHLLQLGAAQLLESIANSCSERPCAIACVEVEPPKAKPIHLTKIRDR